jgi:hypothetical protein
MADGDTPTRCATSPIFKYGIDPVEFIAYNYSVTKLRSDQDKVIFTSVCAGFSM